MEKYNLTGLLEYQEKDKNLYKCEQEYMNSVAKKNQRSINKTIKELQDRSVAYEKEIEQNFSKLKEKCDDANTELASIECELDNYKSINELSEVNAENETLTQILNDIDKIEKYICSKKKSLDDCVTASKTIEQRLVEAYKKLAVINKEVNVKKAELQAIAQPIRSELEVEIKNLDANAYNKYLQVRKLKGLPAVVTLENNCCGACGMDIGIEMQDLNSGEGAECPNCGRIVYKK